MTERSRRVVLLIDYDNLQICAARDTPGRDLQLTPVVQLAQRYGTVILARAYAEWNLSTERLAVYKAGIEPAFAPVLRTESDRSGKSLADTVMVAEGMDMLWTLSPEVVVLATSDKDLIPLVRVAKQRGAFVVVLGSDFTAIPLREMADEHVTYRQLITDVGVRYATEAGPGRQPAALPEPSRRRRERNARERGTVSSSAGISIPPRPEREPTPAPPSASSTPAPALAPATAPGSTSAEPVAPVQSSATGDADSQSSGRRRRRRGSRRRSDRLGLTSGFDGETLNGEDGDPEEADELEVQADVDSADPDVITPTTSAVETGVETIEAEAIETGLTAQPEGAPLVEETPPSEPVAPRRRRTTRRRTEPESAAAEAMPGLTADPEQAPPVPEQPASTAVAPEQSADIMPAPAPEETSPNGASEAEPTTGTRRPRRVASASRGRSRRP